MLFFEKVVETPPSASMHTTFFTILLNKIQQNKYIDQPKASFLAITVTTPTSLMKGWP
jgi:hypothetical protein